ncbi:flagellar hook assembly protein FlgD [Rhizobium oryzicola]|uniref:Basal-body rod modification protein FlgD n=1 Tax=Rhizobium oryzicola TaxID=1232668 RepID=A0ABT8SRJ2_9HYPH|nr:flagellar hook assembly protein FlgD [Rhizobium oryzicola]MDO1581038.1 flagellar hook assembly protein FlgD [Rhizobium oryzicola]
MAVDATSAVNSANPWANAAASTTDANKASVNYDSFLKLLIAQMKNQDPTKPMDATQQISQLASFSQVEQTIQTNNHLKSMLQAEALTRAGDLVGKYIMSADNSVTGKVTQAQVYSDGLMAVTDGGKKVLVQAGVIVSDSPIPVPAAAKTDSTNTAANPNSTSGN